MNQRISQPYNSRKNPREAPQCHPPNGFIPLLLSDHGGYQTVGERGWHWGGGNRPLDLHQIMGSHGWHGLFLSWWFQIFLHFYYYMGFHDPIRLEHTPPGQKL